MKYKFSHNLSAAKIIAFEDIVRCIFHFPNFLLHEENFVKRVELAKNLSIFMHYLWPESVILDLNNRWEEEEKMGVLDIKRRVLFPIFTVPDLKRFLLLFKGNTLL